MRLIEKVAAIGTLMKSPSLSKGLTMMTKGTAGKALTAKVPSKIKTLVGTTTPSRMKG